MYLVLSSRSGAVGTTSQSLTTFSTEQCCPLLWQNLASSRPRQHNSSWNCGQVDDTAIRGRIVDYNTLRGMLGLGVQVCSSPV